MTAAQQPMVLPFLDQYGEHPDGKPWFTHDDRVPRKVTSDYEVRAAGGWRGGHDRSTTCQVAGGENNARMRHLFDVLESSREYETLEDPTDPESEYVVRQDFRATLTCVRCGLVLRWDGTRAEETATSVDPAPLNAGNLVAQQTHVDRFFRHEYSTWSVHDRATGAQVGVISWARGPRGREFYTGRLRLDPSGSWNQDLTAEGDTPTKVLRKLARAQKAHLDGATEQKAVS